MNVWIQILANIFILLVVNAVMFAFTWGRFSSRVEKLEVTASRLAKILNPNPGENRVMTLNDCIKVHSDCWGHITTAFELAYGIKVSKDKVAPITTVSKFRTE